MYYCVCVLHEVICTTVICVCPVTTKFYLFHDTAHEKPSLLWMLNEIQSESESESVPPLPLVSRAASPAR